MPELVSQNGWTRVVFGDVVKLSRERSDDPEDAGLARYVGLEHIEPGDLRIRRWGVIADGTTFTNVFRSGQVLFGKRRAYQRKVAVADFDGVCSGDIYVLVVKNDRLLPELLPYICQTDGFFEHAVGTSAGSLSPRTNWNSLATYEFALPPMEQQRRIAGALAAAGTLHDSLRDLLASALILHRAHLSSIQSSSSFSRVRLGELLAGISAGKSVLGADIAPSGIEYGVLKVSAVDMHGFLPQESKRLINPGDFTPRFSVCSGDLLITRANTPELVGEVCLVERDYPNLMLSDKTLRLAPNPEVDSYLLWEILQSDDVRRQLRSVSTGTGRAMKNISQSKIRELAVAYPSSLRAADSAKTRLLASRQATRALLRRIEECRGLNRSLAGRLLQRTDT